MGGYQTKPSGVEWLGDIPEHWRVDRIKDITTNVVGGDWGYDLDSDVDGEPTVVLRVADLDGIYFSYKNLTIRKIKRGSVFTRALNNHCLVIEKSGGGEKQLVGRTAYPKELKVKAINSNFMEKVELNKSTDARFINYVMFAMYCRRLNFTYVQQTTGIQNLNVTYYLTSKIALPIKSEQQAIADYLDQACAKIDQTLTIKQQQLEKLNAYRKSIIHEAVTKGLDENVPMKPSGVEWLGDVPEHWRISKLKLHSLRIGDGIHTTPQYIDDSTYYFINGNNLINGSIRIKESTRCVSKDEFQKHYIDLKENTLLISINGTIGNLAKYTHEKIILGKSAAYIAPRTSLASTFLYYFFQSFFVKESFNISFQGTTINNLSLFTLRNLKILLPDMEEQKKIVLYLDQSCEKIDQTKQAIQNQIDKLTEYRKSLIHECVTGKKRVFDGEVNHAKQ